MTDDSTPIYDSVYAEAVRKVAPRQFDVWTKLLAGAYAERDLFERKCEDMSAELATLKQRKMAAKFMSLDFGLGAICGSVFTLAFLLERGWIQ